MEIFDGRIRSPMHFLEVRPMSTPNEKRPAALAAFMIEGDSLVRATPSRSRAVKYGRGIGLSAHHLTTLI